MPFKIDHVSLNRRDMLRTSAAASAGLVAGRQQLDWLKREMRASKATWEIVASDMPIGLVVGDGGNFENGANGDGPVRGREFDTAEVLSFIKA